MNPLRKLIEEGNYDEVLSLTEGKEDAESLLYRVSALLQKGEGKEASDLFFSRRETIYAWNPLLTMKTDFELRFLLREFDEAYDDLEHFENLPYVSQQVEEYLRDLPKIIRYAERGQSVKEALSPLEFGAILQKKGNDDEVLAVLAKLSSGPLDPYFPYLESLLASDRSQGVRTYSLLLLVSASYPKEVKFLRGKDECVVNPAVLLPPYTGRIYDSFIEELERYSPDPGIYQTAKRILDSYILNRYPEEVVKKENDFTLMGAVLLLAEEYLEAPSDLRKLLEEHPIDLSSCTSFKERIAKSLAE